MSDLYTGLIAAAVSIIGTIITLFSVRGNLKVRLNELKLKETEIDQRQLEFKINIENKQKDFEITKRNIENELEELRQIQLNKVIEKRLEAYPKLWEIFIIYGTEWVFEEKEYDKEWARNYLNALRNCNKKYGVFFSQDVYMAYHELRVNLTSIAKRFESNKKVTQKECEFLYRIITTGNDKTKGLSTIMKDDLGSYRNSIIQTRKK